MPQTSPMMWLTIISTSLIIMLTFTQFITLFMKLNFKPKKKKTQSNSKNWKF